MSSLMGDLLNGRVTPSVGNATCNAGGKLLKSVEMKMKHGTQEGGQGPKVLNLVTQETVDAETIEPDALPAPDEDDA